MSSSKMVPTPQAEPSVEQSASKTSVWKYAYWSARIFRYIFSLSTLTVPLSFIGLFVVGGGLIRPEILEGSRIFAYMQAVCTPALQFAEKIFNFRTVSHGWNYLLLGIAVVTFFLRQFLMIPVEMLESYVKNKFVHQTVVEAPKIDIKEAGVATAANSSRLAMLREYTEARKFLFSEKRHLAFLSIDVIGSTKMKIGEDKLAIEHAFAEYKKFVERILKKNNIWKVAWTPDGIMCAFHTSADCISAAQDVLRGLPWFNDGVHHLKMGFNVRCGANMGEVVFPENKAMEEISDEVIDVAGHMQKYAAHGALWITKEMLGPEANFEGFHPIADQKVDGHDVLEWRAVGATEITERGASTPAS
jgi:class 3 adenylate cyclase